MPKKSGHKYFWPNHKFFWHRFCYYREYSEFLGRIAGWIHSSEGNLNRGFSMKNYPNFCFPNNNNPSLSARGPTRRRNSAGLAKLCGVDGQFNKFFVPKRKTKVFPVREKLIAPGMQRIEYAVIHKTRRSKRELHN